MASLGLSPGRASSWSPKSNLESKELITKVGGARQWEVRRGQPGAAVLSPASPQRGKERVAAGGGGAAAGWAWAPAGFPVL